MAKTVKFNLICDGNPIRTVDDLRDNFSIEDVLAYYDSKLLHRWLNVRGYTDLFDKVQEIRSDDPMEIIKTLIALFDVEADEKKVEESVYILQYKKEREELLSLYNDFETNANAVIADHQTGYTQLVDRIVDNADDIAVIKAAITEMINNYYWLLEKDHRNLFYKLYYKAPMAVFVMLTHEETRKFYLPQMVPVTKDDEIAEVVETTTDIAKEYDDPEMTQLMAYKKAVYKRVCGLISSAESILGDNLLSFAGVTDGYWKDIETKDKKYMIIDMKPGNYVRSAGKAGQEFGYNDVANGFIIIDGIDYKSNNADHKLLYMEV
ncbi:MAG: hypothetical protein IJ740_05950 [Ruminococcus sp.]|nr:hypothetical protein [Ruminococcus sp.]